MARIGSIGSRFGYVSRRLAPPPKQADPYYSTPEHRRWAAAVVARAGGVCQGAGCGKTGARLIADHIVERRDGGADQDPANGAALCWSCHSKKTAAERAKRTAR